MSSPSKKRKHDGDDDRRKEKKARKHRGDKSASHEFTHVDADIVVAVPPVFAAAPADGVIEMLDSMLMRYIQPLRGVVLSHSDLRFLDSKAELRDVSPFAICHVAFRTVVWSPRIGQRLTGRITLSSPDHVALLLHRTFNAAIPAAHVPRNEWEFVPDADSEDDPMAEEAGDDAPAPAGEDAPTTTGRWVHTSTREPLGGAQRTLSFTVIGLTIANQMLSVVGSILPDPFAPSQTPAVEEPEPEPEPAPTSEPAAADGGDDDIFAALGRSTDAATKRTKHHKRKDHEHAPGDKPRKKKHKHRAPEPAP